MTREPRSAPLRVLEVVTNLDVGGIERWLLEIVPRVDRSRLQLDFACRTILDENRDRLLSLGCQVHLLPDMQHPRRGLAALRRLSATHGPFDAIHTHLHHMTGMLLWMARWSGIRVRIAHSHLDSRPVERNAGRRFLARNAALAFMIRRYATAGLACGRDAAASLYGPGWESDPRWRLLFYGIDLAPFDRPRDGGEARHEVGLPPDAFVVGNIARFASQKNHAFFVDVAVELVKRDPAARFLLLGDGPLRLDVEGRIAAAGLGARFHIVSGRTDVAAFTPAMDVFLFPSVYEGLGIALLEAQAAGLPCVITDSLPAEVGVVPALIQRLPLDAGAAAWADAVMAARQARTGTSAGEALSALRRSAFNIDQSARLLQEFYRAAIDPVAKA